jgi:hypothetical protein
MFFISFGRSEIGPDLVDRPYHDLFKPVAKAAPIFDQRSQPTFGRPHQ